MNALALDIGLKRIGVALCVNESVAVPLNAVLRKNRNQASAEIKALLAKHDIKKLIVGVPKGGASEDEMSRRVRHFVALLEFSGEIHFVDEAYTSKDAAKLANLSENSDFLGDNLNLNSENLGILNKNLSSNSQNSDFLNEILTSNSENLSVLNDNLAPNGENSSVLNDNLAPNGENSSVNLTSSSQILSVSSKKIQAKNLGENSQNFIEIQSYKSYKSHKNHKKSNKLNKSKKNKTSINSRKKDGKIDSLAALIMLKNHFNIV